MVAREGRRDSNFFEFWTRNGRNGGGRAGAGPSRVANLSARHSARVGRCSAALARAASLSMVSDSIKGANADELARGEDCNIKESWAVWYCPVRVVRSPDALVCAIADAWVMRFEDKRAYILSEASLSVRVAAGQRVTMFVGGVQAPSTQWNEGGATKCHGEGRSGHRTGEPMTKVNGVRDNFGVYSQKGKYWKPARLQEMLSGGMLRST